MAMVPAQNASEEDYIMDCFQEGLLYDSSDDLFCNLLGVERKGQYLTELFQQQDDINIFNVVFGCTYDPSKKDPSKKGNKDLFWKYFTEFMESDINVQSSKISDIVIPTVQYAKQRIWEEKHKTLLVWFPSSGETNVSKEKFSETEFLEISEDLEKLPTSLYNVFAHHRSKFFRNHQLCNSADTAKKRLRTEVVQGSNQQNEIGDDVSRVSDDSMKNSAVMLVESYMQRFRLVNGSSLERLYRASKKSGKGSHVEFAIDLYINFDKGCQEAVDLNFDRGACLDIIYNMFEECSKKNIPFDILEEAIVEKHFKRDLEEILPICLAMDKVQCLIRMYNRSEPQGPRGKFYFCKKHFEPDFQKRYPMLSETVEKFRPDYEIYKRDTRNTRNSTMNKYLFQVLFSKTLGSLYANAQVYGQLCMPTRRPTKRAEVVDAFPGVSKDSINAVCNHLDIRV